MPKESKKGKIGIKTARYYTKNCVSCDNKYPNWFTNCPKCGVAWDESVSERSVEAEDLDKKTIKIVVKITEEDFNEEIDHIQLIFSGDQGNSWYQMKMDVEADYFIAEMADVPNGSVIIYYMEVFLANGENFIENNDGKYFYYKVGVPIEEIDEEPPVVTAQILQDNLKFSIPDSLIKDETQNIFVESQSEYNEESAIDSNQKTHSNSDLIKCPHCNSKIKKNWSTCPFCGKTI
jgi:hypothetical protein